MRASANAIRTFVDNATDQVPTDQLATFAQPYEFTEMLHACLAARSCISFTAWGFGDANSWIPGFFTGEGYATLYDVNLNRKAAYTTVQEDLSLARGAPRRSSSDGHQKARPGAGDRAPAPALNPPPTALCRRARSSATPTGG